MSEQQRPHAAWTGLVGVGVLSLGGVAWWLWDRPRDETRTTAEAPGTSSPDGSSTNSTTGNTDGSFNEIKELIESEEFERAEQALDHARGRVGDSSALDDLEASLSFRRQSHRTALRPIEFRILSCSGGDDVADVYARFSIDDVTMYETPFLVPEFASAPDHERRANIATLRTAIARGVTVELLEPGGFFGGDETVFGPRAIAPLPNRKGGEITLEDPGAEITHVVLAYAPSPYAPGLYPDESPEPAPEGASAGALITALTEALAADRIDIAETLLARFSREHAEHPDMEFARERVAERRASLQKNRSTVRFIIVEAAIDPPAAGEVWASGGETPPFLGAVEVGDEEFEGDGELIPYLVPGLALNAPKGNVIDATGRGDVPLRFKLYDTSPTFGRSDVGAVYLERTLGDFPAGTGTLVLEREPGILLLPDRAKNRLRRLVLRYAVER